MPSDKDQVTAAELGRFLGLSDRGVRDLAAKGTIERAGRGRYPLQASAQAYCAHLREVAAGRGGEAATASLAAERTRLAKERADEQGMKNQRLREELVLSADVEREWTAILADVRAAVLALPTRIHQRCPHLTRPDVREIDMEVRATLEALSGGDANGE